MTTISPPTTGSMDPLPVASVASSGTDTAATSDINYLRDRARKSVMEAVATLPAEENQAYLNALANSPTICELESDPLIFLRTCDYNVQAAAERICLYWKERQDLFGARALLPMTQTGHGALTREDALSLHAGWPAILPRSTTSGLQVVVFDRRQSHPRCTSENRLRCIFYCSHIVAQDERAQVEGVIVLVIVTTKTGVDRDFDEFNKRSIFLAKRALPIKPLTEFLVQSAPGIKRYTIQDALAVMVGYYLHFGATQDNLEVNTKREDGGEMMLDRLYQLGLTAEGIPQCLGGTWTYTNFTAWCKDQKSIELESMETTSLEPHVKQQMKTSRKSGIKKDAATKQRERNIIHSRRKRERRKQEEDQIRQECCQLERERLELVAETNKLEGLLNQARQYLMNASPDDIMQ